mmetsp:Transcript_94616/g.187463  ORF Transcript_94616/g.187463 Transcript_94616/m.187463 type:complete len:94 (+) Transcript_94616:109-390(+)
MRGLPGKVAHGRDFGRQNKTGSSSHTAAALAQVVTEFTTIARITAQRPSWRAAEVSKSATENTPLASDAFTKVCLDIAPAGKEKTAPAIRSAT